MDNNNRGHVYHTLNNKIIDLRNFDYEIPQFESEIKYGWEACMYWSNIYHKELDNAYIQINKGDIFVDLGANIGMSATYAELKGASKIYCIEPDPKIFECLRKNSGPNWVLENIAISNYIGELEMGYWPDTLNNRFITKCTTLYEYVRRNNIEKIDYLKIDIEGAEDEVIRTIDPGLFKIINKVMVEYHFDDMKKINKFIQIFTNNGFNHHIDYGNQSLISFWK